MDQFIVDHNLVNFDNLGNPNDQTLKEYIVTLKDMNDSGGFYADMETEGGSLYIPKRVVDCHLRRPTSRNTHYMLSYDEAAQVKNDPRVLTVELNPRDRGMVKSTLGFTQTSTHFDKRVASDSNDINWGLLRTLRATNIPNWGDNGFEEQIGTLLSDCSGKNVDVVIMDDGCPYPTVYEYAQNPDGTGYSRMVEYNWGQHDPEITGSEAITIYDYPGSRLQEHGGHTTGTVAGNTQGWARDANIYNITFYDSIDYVREFHKNKPINPLTGVKNPTVMNNSWGYSLYGSFGINYISRFTVRGVDYYPTSGTNGSYSWSNEFITQVARLGWGSVPMRDAATDADMIDAMAEGVIVVASAGNSYYYQDVEGGEDWNNCLYYGASNTQYFYHRGSSPGATDGGTEETKVICVGATGLHNDSTGYVYDATHIAAGDFKAEFSNYGPRIDVFAPGSGIQSVWNSSGALYDSISTPDPRLTLLGGTDTVNNNFKKCPGTSMSGPQVAGVLACVAEKYPRMTQAEARAYIARTSPHTLQSTTGGSGDHSDAGLAYSPRSNNQMLLLKGTRVHPLDVGTYTQVPFPENTSQGRPTSGQTMPRRRALYSGAPKATFAIASDVATVNYGNSFNVTVTTTNIPNGTKVPYIITGRYASAPPDYVFDEGFSGVCTADSIVTGLENFNTEPNSGNRIVTTGATTGTYTPLTNNLLGTTGMLMSQPGSVNGLTFNGTDDDGFWTVPLPFPITFLDQSYSTIYIGTNSYITFSGGSSAYWALGVNNPSVAKIMVSANDNSLQRVYRVTSGTAPNRTFRIRYEGTANPAGVYGSPDMVYEVTFYESNPAQIDLHTGVNARRVTLPNTNPYSFDAYALSVPLTGTVTINDDTATLPISLNTLDNLLINVRLGIFPAPNVTVTINS